MPKYVYESVKCPFCDEVRKSTGLHHHIKTHGPEKWNEYNASKETLKYKQDEDIFHCIECEFSSESRQSVTSHWWRNHTEKGKAHVAFGTGPKKAHKRKTPAWNKGLTKETDPRVAKYGQTISEIFQKQIKEGTYVPHRMGEEARQRLSERQSLHNVGGRSKWYDVGGKKVQGTYELKFAQHLEEQKILWEKIKKNSGIFKYQKDGKIKSYTPDFFLPELNVYVEVKGRWWDNDEDKMKLVRRFHRDKNLIVLYGKKKLDLVCQDIRKNLLLEPVWLW